MMREAYVQRLVIVLAKMEEKGIGWFLIGPSATMKYLVGYNGRGDERLLVLVIAAGRKPFILANKLYELQVGSAPVDEFIYWGDGEDAVELLMRTLKERDVDISSVAVDKAMPGMFLIPISQKMSKSVFCLGNSIVDELRTYKDEEEMKCMIRACEAAAIALKNTISRGRWWIGKTESDFRSQLCQDMTEQGINAHGAIVAVGAHAAVPHHSTGQTVIEDGSCMLVDYGGNYDGYCSDMTRTFHFGEPSDEFKKVYEIVQEANRRGQEAAKIGNLLQDVDRAARSYIDSQGYGAYFTHRTGHGIGLGGHEGPSAAEGVEVPIAPGMAFSIEPGIYLPGKFGVRIEDQALITKDGLKILHDFPRELQIIK